MSELIAKNINATGPNCIGCQRHGSYVMVSYQSEKIITPFDSNHNSIHDIFLTKEQAVALVQDLIHAIAQDPREDK